MSGQPQDEHYTWWTPSPEGQAEEYIEMQEKSRKYKERAWGAIDEKLFPLPPSSNHPDFKVHPKHLWVNDEHDGIVKINVIQEQGNTLLPSFPEDATRDLLMYATRAPLIDETRRRIIIVEYINSRFAELLGVRLNIPPEFFFAHCSELLSLSVVNYASSVQPDRYWRVPIPQRRWLPRIAKEHIGMWSVESGFYDRQKVFVNDHKGLRIDFDGQVSYWATEYDHGSWTVVLLVDPNETILRNEKNPDLTMELQSYRFFRRLATEVLPSATERPLIQAEHRSLYDSLVHAHNVIDIDHNCTPSSGTAFIRHFVRAAWEERICRNEWLVNDELLNDQYKHQDYTGINSLQRTHDEENRNAKKYQSMIQIRRELKEHRKRLKSISYAFVSEDEGPHLGQGSYAKLKLALDRERRLWARLEDRLATMEATISDHMEGYSSRAAMEESFAASRQAKEASEQTEIANRHARSAGQLTKIATIIVPCTFVASIFSMNGSFAAGSHLFYVYWAVSVPATVALLVWVLHGDIKDLWQKARTKRLSNQEKVKAKRSGDQEKADKMV